MSEELKKYREKIDRIDDELLKLINQRAALAQQIGHVKGNGAVLRPEREAQVLQRMVQANTGPLSNQGVTQLFTEIMSQCRALEAPLKVAYLGPHGTFSEAAVFQRFGQATEGLPADSIDSVFGAVESGAANYGLVPVENSTEGAIGRTLDLLLNSNLKICGEVLLQVHQCLLSNENDLSLIRKVYSHPQSFGQTQGWLNAHLPHAERITASSNADAARLAAEESFAAAVAGERAAEHFKLKVLVPNIEDDARNTTRFLVIGKQDVAPSGKDKTSLAMSRRESSRCDARPVDALCEQRRFDDQNGIASVAHRSVGIRVLCRYRRPSVRYQSCRFTGTTQPDSFFRQGAGFLSGRRLNNDY